MRTFFIYLMIAALLLCPYECAVRLAAAQTTGNDTHAACCEQCQARQAEEPTAPDHEQLPAPSEDGRSCLCEGAVFDATARSPLKLSLQAFLWIEASNSAQTPTHGLSVMRFDRGEWPEAEASGRLARIAIRSLLL
jgi:hypothetical protein